MTHYLNTMKKLNIHPSIIPMHNIVFVTTSEPDYEMDRAMLIEDYPDYGDFIIVTGSHCSCFGFGDVEWDVILYSELEILDLMKSWNDKGYGAERIIAPLVLEYLRE